MMPTIDLGIATLSCDLHFPTVDGDIQIVVPAGIPQLSSKTFPLPGFSLSVKEQSASIPVDIPQFSGQITVNLDFTRCEVNIAGTVILDSDSGHEWRVGPAA